MNRHTHTHTEREVRVTPPPEIRYVQRPVSQSEDWSWLVSFFGIMAITCWVGLCVLDGSAERVPDWQRALLTIGAYVSPISFAIAKARYS